MTDLYDGRIADLLQNQLSNNPEVEALAYAVLQEKHRIIDAAKRTRTMAVIDQLPEAILDVLAVELRSPYYRQELPVERKRSIIKSTLRWFTSAGTPSAMRELVEAVFDEGQIVEWFDFDPADGEIVPGEFDILANTTLTPDAVTRLLQIIGKVKNVRSHLRRVLVERHGYIDEFTGSGTITAPFIPVLNGGTDRQINSHGKAVFGAGVITAPRIILTCQDAPRDETVSGTRKAKAALVVRDHFRISNAPPPGTVELRRPLAVFVAVASSTKITIPQRR